jgi:hypothetical protein
LRRIVVGRGHQLGLPRPLLDAVSLRLTRMAARFDYLLTRALQTPPQSAPKPPRLYRPRPERPHTPDLVPRHHAWLLRLAPARETEANACMPLRASIEQCLADPAMRAAIAQNPALHPPLRALCRMLGIPRPTHLPAPTRNPTPTPPKPRKPRRPHSPRPSPFPPAPRQPTPWDQRQAFRRCFGPPRAEFL